MMLVLTEKEPHVPSTPHIAALSRRLTTDVLIVGAGPYGIAIAHELEQRGIECLVVGRPFSMWRDHTLSGMRLRTPVAASSVYTPNSEGDLSSFLAKDPRVSSEAAASALPVETYRFYLREVEQRLVTPIVEQHVLRLERHCGRFLARCFDSTELAARSVVVATGLGPHRYVPPALRRLPRSHVIHTWEARRLESLRGDNVLVVGQGQSAVEAVSHLRRRNRVTWALRKKLRLNHQPLAASGLVCRLVLRFGDDLHRLPRALLRRINRQLGRSIAAPEAQFVYADDTVEKIFGDVSELGLRENAGRIASSAGVHFDHVVAATGYAFSLTGLRFLSAELCHALAENPEIGAEFQTSVPGLFLVGPGAVASHGLTMQLLHGCGPAARRLGARLAHPPRG